jgi:cyclic pyranopterin phosphate synthase
MQPSKSDKSGDRIRLVGVPRERADSHWRRYAEDLGVIATVDTLARPLRELRISVTDRCNFRCSYCMPKEIFGGDFVFMPRDELLTFEEIARVARLFAEQGVKKLRLTGGEPLLRRDLERLIEMLAGTDGIADIALTTNGAALAGKAQALKHAGLTRVSVSLDALDDEVFGAMNDVGFPVRRVLEGIDAAAHVGLLPVKVNMVVKRGVNDHCILAMAEYFRERPAILRLIEFMDVGTTNRWKPDEVVPAAEIHRMIDARWPLEPLAASHPGEVASRYRYRDGGGQIGLIASVTKPFCGSCTRARLSADGKLHTCLFATSGHDLRALLRGGASDQEITRQLRSIWTSRADRYSETRTALSTDQPKVEMSYIGG